MHYAELVKEAYERISPYIKKTPILKADYFSQKTDATILLKCEIFQHTNSFKVRGAFNKLTKVANKRGKVAVAASGGNHGLAVTYAAKQFGMQALIVVPDFIPQFRIDMIKTLGGDVLVAGRTLQEASLRAQEYLNDSQYVFIHPFDDEDVILGQATLAYELLQQETDIDAIFVSIGGGGLIAGIAQYVHEKNPHIEVYGTQTIGADAMTQSLEAHKIVVLPEITSIATSLGATQVADRTFSVVSELVKQVIAVPDAEAIRDLKDLLAKEKVLVEPATSCNLSAILSGKITDLAGKKIVVIACGANLSLEQLKKML